ncbi:MAG: tetratricopeptide repeat protein [Hyphomicrobium sp.]|uniref:tetratricopeptide repeat protein n=1 Tax=Hyphomicrobium sp. TaxID=82 RepID=UPI003D09BEA2
MKRRIAAVLMADVAGPAATAGLVRDAVQRGGGRMLSNGDGPPLAEFQSAVEAVRAAVDVLETLRMRNKGQPAEERASFKVGITIGEVIDGAELPDETRADVIRLTKLAGPRSVCVSRAVREAVAGKLKLRALDVTVEGVLPDDPPTVAERVQPPPKPPPASARSRFAGSALPWAVAAVACVAAVLMYVLAPGHTPAPPRTAAPEQAALSPPPAEPDDTQTKITPAPSSGKLEFKPAYAPDPATVLTARRMLPQAWRDCTKGSADKAVAACKLLLDSGIPKGAELAAIHLSDGKALRERHELDKATQAFGAAIAAEPSAEAFSLRGTVHFDKGDWQRAIADYTDAIRLEPRNGEAYNNRAWTYYRAERHTEALADADKAVELLGKEAYVWDTRAHIHASLGNRDAAISDFRAALAIDPANAASKAGLASLGVN